MLELGEASLAQLGEQIVDIEERQVGVGENLGRHIARQVETSETRQAGAVVGRARANHVDEFVGERGAHVVHVESA